jgi:alcohol dehydrogenase
MPTIRAVQVAKAGGDFELVERAIPEPGPSQVRIPVEACGINKARFRVVLTIGT